MKYIKMMVTGIAILSTIAMIGCSSSEVGEEVTTTPEITSSEITEETSTSETEETSITSTAATDSTEETSVSSMAATSEAEEVISEITTEESSIIETSSVTES